MKDAAPALDEFFAQEDNVRKTEAELATSGHISNSNLWIIANFPEQSIPHLTKHLASHLKQCSDCRVGLDGWLEELYVDVSEVRDSVRKLIQERLK